MKNPKKLIKLLYHLCSGLYFLARIVAFFISLGLIISIFTYSSDNVQDDIKAKERGTVIIDSTYTAKTDAYIAGYEDAKRSKRNLYERVFKTIRYNNQTFVDQLVNVFTGFLIIALFLFSLRETKRLFKRLNELVKNNEWFCISIYKSLIRLAYLSLIYVIGVGVLSLWQTYYGTYFYFLGLEIHFIGWDYYIESLTEVSISFIIAAVYKAGVDMHEEQSFIV